MSHTRSPELAALMEELSDGQWHDGMTVMRAVERIIPPGEASRTGARRRNAEGATPEELIRTGRREKVRAVVLSALQRGRVEIDVQNLGRAAWRGEVPWRLRDPFAGYLSVAQMADELDVDHAVIRSWAQNGYVPYSITPGGMMRFSPAEAAICRRVHAVYRPGAVKWSVDPRSLWNEEDVERLPTISCPHCGEAVTLTVGKP